MSKRVLVVVDTERLPRIREALRAALGLSLRGDRVRVLVADLGVPDADADRARAMLIELGHVVAPLTNVTEAIADSDAVQVWT